MPAMYRRRQRQAAKAAGICASVMDLDIADLAAERNIALEIARPEYRLGRMRPEVVRDLQYIAYSMLPVGIGSHHPRAVWMVYQDMVHPMFESGALAQIDGVHQDRGAGHASGALK
jgi:hypothetical protein